MCPVSAVLGVGSALIGASSSRKAAKTQAAAARDAAGVQQDIFDQTTENFAPFLKAGQDALPNYLAQIGSEFTESPGYQFRLDQGLDAIEGRAAAQGNLQSGSTLQALTEHGQNFATANYDQWLNRLGGVVNAGQNAAGQQGTFGANFANAQGDMLTSGANATAAGQIGVGNALQGGLNTGLGIWQYQQGLNNNQFGNTSGSGGNTVGLAQFLQ